MTAAARTWPVPGGAVRPLVWQVIWIDADGHGLGGCGHRHATAGEATLCTFEPAGLPEVCAGLVREVRDPDYRTPGGRAPRTHRRAQLELALEAG